MSLISWWHGLWARPTPKPQPAPTLPTGKIAWGNDDWTRFCSGLATTYFQVFDRSDDIHIIRPDWDSLTQPQKILVIVQLFAAVSKFESDWDPTEYSVDAGEPDDRDSWSVGLMQMSVCDQENYHAPLGYSFEDLQKPYPNLQLAFVVMNQQIQHMGKIMLTHGQNCYWSTLSYGYPDSEIPKILGIVQSLTFPE